MKTINVLSGKNLPSRPFGFITTYVLWYLFFEHVNAPKWLYIAVGVLYGLGFLGTFVRLCIETSIDMFEDITTKQEAKKTFREKLNEMAEKRKVNQN